MFFYIRHRFLCGHNMGHTEVMQLCPTAEATQGLHCVAEGSPVEDLVVRVIVHSHCHSCRGTDDTEQASAGAEMDKEYAEATGLLLEPAEQPFSNGMHRPSSPSSSTTTTAPPRLNIQSQQTGSQPSRPSPLRNSVAAGNQQSESTTTTHASYCPTQPPGAVDPYVRALTILEMDAVDGLLNLRRGPTSHPRNP